MEKGNTEEAKRQGTREIALKNLKSLLGDLAVAYYVNKSKQYGEAGNSAVDQYIYAPALRSGAGQEILHSAIMQSREEGEPYSGSVSEHKIIKTAAGIIQESLSNVKVQDILDLMGKSEANVNYKEAYISDLVNSEDKEAKEFVGKLLNIYQSWNVDAIVSKALKKRSEAVKGGLEEILSFQN